MHAWNAPFDVGSSGSQQPGWGTGSHGGPKAPSSHSIWHWRDTHLHRTPFRNLMLTLVILWAYTSFAQLLVVWQGNTREDIGYYTHRGLGIQPNPWRWVALALLLGHFLTPFFCLLMRGLKRKVGTLAAIAAFLFFMRIIESLWLTAPGGPHRQSGLDSVYWTDITAWLGIGGLWIFVFLLVLAGRQLLPQNATDQPEIISHGSLAHSH